ncbi:hypothetical protein LNO08_04480 [Klebsiella pneumoniae subsp. pneumoniae]|nr:hypothetical protein [Klebsiella pneumoniae subsp. pneumoniae]
MKVQKIIDGHTNLVGVNGDNLGIGDFLSHSSSSDNFIDCGDAANGDRIHPTLWTRHSHGCWAFQEEIIDVAQLPSHSVESFQQLVNVFDKTNFDLVYFGLRALNVIVAKGRSAIWVTVYENGSSIEKLIFYLQDECFIRAA